MMRRSIPKSTRRRQALRKLAHPRDNVVKANPEANRLAHRIGKLLLDKKALDVLILDVRGQTSYADYFVIATGESERQVTAMAEHVETTLSEASVQTLGIEGTETGRWVLMDFGDVVAHLFLTDVRVFYDLEGLWTDVPREKVA